MNCCAFKKYVESPTANRRVHTSRACSTSVLDGCDICRFEHDRLPRTKNCHVLSALAVQAMCGIANGLGPESLATCKWRTILCQHEMGGQDCRSTIAL